MFIATDLADGSVALLIVTAMYRICPCSMYPSIKIDTVFHMCYDSILWAWWMNEVTINRVTIIIIKVIVTRSFVRRYL